MDSKQAEIEKRNAYRDIGILADIQTKSVMPQLQQGKINELKQKINRLENRQPRK